MEILELSAEIVKVETRSLQERQTALLAALDSFMEQDEEEHRETLHVLRHALNEERQGQRLVFDTGSTPQ